MNVYEAALTRIQEAIETHADFYVSFSGGKDSGVLVNLVLEVAARLDRLPVKVVFSDLEAIFQETARYTRSIMDRPDVEPYWLCLPEIENNATSVYQRYFRYWDTREQPWARDMHGSTYSPERRGARDPRGLRPADRPCAAGSAHRLPRVPSIRDDGPHPASGPRCRRGDGRALAGGACHIGRGRKLMATRKNRPLGETLKASLVSEDDAVRRRFEQADRIMLTPVSPTQVAETVEPEMRRSGGGDTSRGVVRLAYSLPPDEASMMDEMQLRAARGGHLLNRSELVRAALLVLDGLSETDFDLAVRAVIKLKPGRPLGS